MMLLSNYWGFAISFFSDLKYIYLYASDLSVFL